MRQYSSSGDENAAAAAHDGSSPGARETADAAMMACANHMLTSPK